MASAIFQQGVGTDLAAVRQRQGLPGKKTRCKRSRVGFLDLGTQRPNNYIQRTQDIARIMDFLRCPFIFEWQTKMQGVKQADENKCQQYYR